MAMKNNTKLVLMAIQFPQQERGKETMTDGIRNTAVRRTYKAFFLPEPTGPIIILNAYARIFDAPSVLKHLVLL
jgi:hypothetical protein